MWAAKLWSMNLQFAVDCDVNFVSEWKLKDNNLILFQLVGSHLSDQVNLFVQIEKVLRIPILGVTSEQYGEYCCGSWNHCVEELSEIFLPEAIASIF